MRTGSSKQGYLKHGCNCRRREYIVLLGGSGDGPTWQCFRALANGVVGLLAGLFAVPLDLWITGSQH